MTFELNNNINNKTEIYPGSYKRNRNQSIVSVSSASSCHSDSSEDVEGLSQKPPSIAHESHKNHTFQKNDFSRFRSMSDGATNKLLNQEPFEVFPSLPDSVLDEMRLLDNNTSEQLDENEIEEKFVTLSIAFKIDATTIKNRCERQRRYRDQTETNLSVEIEKLIEKANRIQPLCIDAETTELLSALLAQIEIVMNAASHATISAERYGAVQHENRISDSVSLMLSHVNLLKEQRDSARRQLQYTKRVLQNSNESDTGLVPKQILTNSKIITKRRASIATITQPIELKNGEHPKKITRRTSEMAIRASPSLRNSRPSRLELGGDLTKIKEGLAETEVPSVKNSSDQSDNESNHGGDNSSPDDLIIISDLHSCDINNSLRHRLMRRFQRLLEDTEKRYERWNENGTIHEICCFCALMCFSISIIFLANMFIEIEFAKRGIHSSGLWFWTETASNKRLQQPNT